jgi:hypothetical protein
VLVYIEYLTRLPGVSVEQFHFALGRVTAAAWTDQHPEDVLVLNLGRTFRVGPEPPYLMVWYNERSGLERIGDWDRIFKSGVSDHVEETARMAASLDQAGCYEPLLDPVQGSRGPYYGEFFDVAEGASREDVRDFFVDRRSNHPALELDLLVDRIGKLGPEPRGLAIWRAPSFGDLEAIVRELDRTVSPISLVRGAFYENLGDEEI